uniref:Uncharacterized protein n=1 Tax=Catharus ustulatus TaxID=91951 RepID=A0A8C3U5N6_CATUS
MKCLYFVSSASRFFQVLVGQGSFFFCLLKVFEIHMPATPPGKPENLHQYYSVTWLPTQHRSKTSAPPRNMHAPKSKQSLLRDSIIPVCLGLQEIKPQTTEIS